MPEDVEVALTLLGLRPDGLPEQVTERLAAEREHWLDVAAHEHTKGEAFLASLVGEALIAAPEDLRRRLAEEV